MPTIAGAFFFAQTASFLSARTVPRRTTLPTILISREGPPDWAVRRSDYTALPRAFLLSWGAFSWLCRLGSVYYGVLASVSGVPFVDPAGVAVSVNWNRGTSIAGSFARRMPRPNSQTPVVRSF